MQYGIHISLYVSWLKEHDKHEFSKSVLYNLREEKWQLVPFNSFYYCSVIFTRIINKSHYGGFSCGCRLCIPAQLNHVNLFLFCVWSLLVFRLVCVIFIAGSHIKASLTLKAVRLGFKHLVLILIVVLGSDWVVKQTLKHSNLYIYHFCITIFDPTICNIQIEFLNQESLLLKSYFYYLNSLGNINNKSLPSLFPLHF